MAVRRLRKVVAVVAGVLIAGVPVVMIHRGVDAYIERLATEDVRLTAQRAIARAEWRIGQTIAALTSIGASGLRECSDIDADTVRRVVMSTTPIKQVAVVDASGHSHCLPFVIAEPHALSRELRTADDRVFLSVMPAFAATKVTVNGVPISDIEIAQRTKLLALEGGGGTKKATDQLIDEQLQLQEAKRMNIVINGRGCTLNGHDQHRLIFVAGGNVTLLNFNLKNGMADGGQGGDEAAVGLPDEFRVLRHCLPWRTRSDHCPADRVPGTGGLYRVRDRCPDDSPDNRAAALRIHARRIEV